MSLLDALRNPRPAENSEYATHGEQPGPHASGRLVESGVVLDAMTRRDNAAALEAARGNAEVPPLPPVVIVDNAAEPEFKVATFTLSPGEVVEIAGRDPRRKTLEINLWTADAVVVICSNRKDAESSSHKFPPARSKRLPGGGNVPSKTTHTAPVFAVLDPAHVGDATVDVIATLAAPARRSTTRKHDDD